MNTVYTKHTDEVLHSSSRSAVSTIEILSQKNDISCLSDVKKVVNEDFKSIESRKVSEIVDILVDKGVPHLEPFLAIGFRNISENIPSHLNTKSDQLAYQNQMESEFLYKIAHRIKEGFYLTHAI